MSGSSLPGIVLAVAILSSVLGAKVRSNPSDFTSLGELNIQSPTPITVPVDTTALTIELLNGTTLNGVVSPLGRAVFAFDRIEIGANVTLSAQGDLPFSLLSRSELLLNGWLDASGFGVWTPSFLGGPAGGEGGGFNEAGSGPGGGPIVDGGGHGGAGGAGVYSLTGSGGSAYGGPSVFQGGSGGGGPWQSNETPGGGGGGALELGAGCCIELQLGSAVIADGGDALAGGGGSGSGGFVFVHAPEVRVDGLITASGGPVWTGCPTDSGGGAGGGGYVVVHSANSIPTGVNVKAAGGYQDSFFYNYSYGYYGVAGQDGFPGVTQYSGYIFEDCNANGLRDRCELLTGAISDLDGDELPDDCGVGPNYCFGDGGVSTGCTDCPCGNSVPGSAGGCANGSGTSSVLIGSGSPSIGADTLRFELSGANPSSMVILASGVERAPLNPTHPCFGLGSGIHSSQMSGLRCIAGFMQRHGARSADSGGAVGAANSGWGTPDGPSGGIAGTSGYVAGQTRHFQAYYSEVPFASCARRFNSSQGVSVRFRP